MARKYTKDLLKSLKEKESTIDYYGAEILVKNLPDCDEKGAIDPRLYQKVKNRLKIFAAVSADNFHTDLSTKGIEKLRKTFHSKTSTSCIETPISIERRNIQVSDGYLIPVRIYRNKKTTSNSPLLYYIHGGGFMGGSPEVVEESLKLFVEKTNLCVLSVDYRLAPEYPYPTGHNDCYDVLTWIYANASSLGIDPEHIFIAGDSAGGNLAQYCTTKDYESGTHIVKGQLLLYPSLNMANIKDEYFQPSMASFEMAPKQKKGLTTMIEIFRQMTDEIMPVLGTTEINNDYLNPYTREAKKNPPTFLAVGEHDYLKFETLGYGVKLHHAGVSTKIILYKGFGHSFFNDTGIFPQCEDCIEEMGNFILNYCKN